MGVCSVLGMGSIREATVLVQSETFCGEAQEEGLRTRNFLTRSQFRLNALAVLSLRLNTDGATSLPLLLSVTARAQG